MSQTKTAKSSMEASSEGSPASSCVSSDAAEEEDQKPMMVVAGCPRCLMYVMLSDSESEDQEKEKKKQKPKCPRCKSPVLMHFHEYHCDTKNKI
ncbi:hypothetical protein BRADI_3g13007v3 [Brachypodium distachyon]|uniref:GIR1-like zinc ribbon domain-containing protein n=1 Tax=Brachypodium distachyon TaxID=15368 RepID=I1I094_BRADI|nr:hypothetical protein BRADI_3g13007v3 [Brachypodium distachyon]KQJ94760.1 hypothetical protein BRADI_3g13007v3 [Brachypodium distachyon]PNT66487.1 hypothetical protein BRADI_3g13007v3 [Brachypodium distachyon]PNT66488.1 hypothetical protein BRADI_3g13007v3 [Brachypodium distachyon]PNT66489.1 hypothetical protein BRADI_3g13007v3 [Brachypodium distachyon]